MLKAPIQVLVWAACAALLLVNVAAFVGDQWFVREVEARNYQRAGRLADGLASLGRERASWRLEFGERLLRDRHFGAAREQLRLSETLAPEASAKARVLIGMTHEAQQEWRQAAEAYELVRPAIEGTAVRPPIEGAIAAVTQLAWDGRGDDAMALAERAYAAHLETWEHELFQSDPGIHMLGIIVALSHDGRLDEAEELLSLAWAGASSDAKSRTWRSASENFALFWAMSPSVAMRIVWLSAVVVTPRSAARSKRGLMTISGRTWSPTTRGATSSLTVAISSAIWLATACSFTGSGLPR